jgi:hypothetical protein
MAAEFLTPLLLAQTGGFRFIPRLHSRKNILKLSLRNESLAAPERDGVDLSSYYRLPTLNAGLERTLKPLISGTPARA